MELVIVERQFEQPMQFEDIQAVARAGSWCRNAHRVRFLKTIFSRDGRRMLCFYEAPDAEAVRLAEEKAEVPFQQAWTCSHLRNDGAGEQAGAAEIATEYVIVERLFPEPVTSDFVVNALREKAWCLDLHRAEYVESYLAADGLRMVCLFRAPDAESVRLANKQAAVPYTNVWTASLHVPG